MESIADIRQLPELGDDTIHVWGVYVPDVLDRLDALYAVLCAEEREKAARFLREPDRQSSVGARGALRILLCGYTGIPANEIGFGYSENGKPYLTSPTPGEPSAKRSRPDACGTISFNVSHSGEWVVLAFGRDRHVGVDVEKIRRDLDIDSIVSRYFTLAENALINQAEDPHAVFFQIWARKEAFVKARGTGLFQELNSVPVPIDNGVLPEMGEKDGWIFRRLEAGSKYAAAVVTDKPFVSLPCYDFGGLKWEN